MHGDMAWLERGAERRCDPRLVVPGARSVVVLTRSYYTGHEPCPEPLRARVSRYAWGAEYHEVMGRAVAELYRRIVAAAPAVSGRYYVDTGPVLEKVWAELAGLGWIGKHTNLVTVGEGSWFFLAAIVLDAELEYGEPARDHCGRCRACIDVCPTQAIVAPYVLDARRCISYLTIEHRGPIPRALRPAIGNRVFGCDDCQEVCPWNRFARLGASARPFAPRPGNAAPLLARLLALDETGFRDRFRHTPIRRAKRAGLARNAAVALGNSGRPEAVEPPVQALADRDALVRGHAAWALGRLGGQRAASALRRAAIDENDPWAAREVRDALEEIGAGV